MNGMVEIPLTINNPRGCFDKEEVCVQVGSAPIVANYVHDVRQSGWSECLPQSSFQISGNKLYIPAQYKSDYKVRVSTYHHEYQPVYQCGAGAVDSCTNKEFVGYHDVKTANPNPFNAECYFDTRVQPISGTGTNCSKALASVADNKSICGTSYPEARTLMNARIAQILQPFHEENECQTFTCPSGKRVELCGCDATGNGVTIDSLDVLNSSVDYIDRSNTSPDKVNGVSRYLDRCARGNVIFFDPPSGGSVTLDAPGEDFVLPPYPVTLVVRGADLRIKDNLIYPKNSNASLGVILLKNNICGGTYGGNVYLHPDPTNVVGAYYLDGSVKSTDANWSLPADRQDVRWYQILKNQILWEGTILSLNSIGGAVNPSWPASGDPSCAVPRRPYQIGGGFPDPSWQEAVGYDLAYLREYFRCGNLTAALSPYGSQNWKVSGCDNTSNPYSEIAYDELPLPEPAKGTNAPEAVVLRYDSRIQNNPPPGFDGIADFLQSELGM
ncbi:MAG: hypothetical protein V2A63_02925 [Patescibacteria group bacterium]